MDAATQNTIMGIVAAAGVGIGAGLRTVMARVTGAKEPPINESLVRIEDFRREVTEAHTEMVATLRAMQISFRDHIESDKAALGAILHTLEEERQAWNMVNSGIARLLGRGESGR